MNMVEPNGDDKQQPKPEPRKRWWRFLNWIPLGFILFYRKCLSPLMPPACRFHPTCSAYGLEAFQRHPPHRALWLTVWRILRCNPFNPGGYDPVPLPGEKKGSPPLEDRSQSKSGDDS